MKVVIVDYGAGNLHSVARAVESQGVRPMITSSSRYLDEAEALIVPGVGAAEDTMSNLRSHGLVEPIKEYIDSGRPFLGVCMGQQALFELKQEHRKQRDLLLLSLTYWDACGGPPTNIPNLTQKQMGHACEWETSMVLRIAPQLVVGDHAKVPEVPHGKAFGPGYRAWVMPDRSEPGHIGNPAAATAEKGEALFAYFSAGVVSYLERVVAWDGTTWDY